MGRRYKPGRNAGRGGLGWVLALVCLLVGIGAGGAGLAWFVHSRPNVEAATLCPETGPVGADVILLDLTDPLSPIQARRLRSAIADKVDAAPHGNLFVLAAVSEPGAAQVFLRCKPQSGQAANALYENPKLIAEAFATGFATPLNRMLDGALMDQIQDQSPILETLQEMLSQAPLGTGEVRLMLVSDLLQNSPILSVYRGESWEQFVDAGHASRLSGLLMGAKVEVMRLPRPNADQATLRAAEEFWVRYFDAQGIAGAPQVTVLGDL